VLEMKSRESLPANPLEGRLGTNLNREVPVQPLPNNGMDLATMSRMLNSSNLGFGLSNMNGSMDIDMAAGQVGPCIWVTGIAPDIASPKVICNIFGNYGNVQRVKFSQKKPDGALIEMSGSEGAANCKKHFDKITICNKRLFVSLSKLPEVKILPRDNEDKAKDFSQTRVHRFGRMDSKFTQTVMRRLSAPTAVLIVSRIPTGKVEDVKEYIIESGFKVKGVKEGKSKEGADKTMAFFEFVSPDEAIQALGKLHDTMASNIGQKENTKQGYRGLCFSFTSKNGLDDNSGPYSRN